MKNMWIKLNEIMIESSVLESICVNGKTVKAIKRNGEVVMDAFSDEESAKAAFESAYNDLKQASELEQEERKHELLRHDSVRKYINDTRTLNVLERMGCYTIGDLELMSEKELVKNRGVGVHVQRTVRDTLGNIGLKMAN